MAANPAEMLGSTELNPWGKPVSAVQRAEFVAWYAKRQGEVRPYLYAIATAKRAEMHRLGPLAPVWDVPVDLKDPGVHRLSFLQEALRRAGGQPWIEGGVLRSVPTDSLVSTQAARMEFVERAMQLAFETVAWFGNHHLLTPEEGGRFLDNVEHFARNRRHR